MFNFWNSPPEFSFEAVLIIIRKASATRAFERCPGRFYDFDCCRGATRVRGHLEAVRVRRRNENDKTYLHTHTQAHAHTLKCQWSCLIPYSFQITTTTTTTHNSETAMRREGTFRAGGDGEEQEEEEEEDVNDDGDQYWWWWWWFVGYFCVWQLSILNRLYYIDQVRSPRSPPTTSSSSSSSHYINSRIT